MSDTVNQVIQTLEGIASDIRDAKQALKTNNVTPDSNSTSTLAAEINKVPTGIKESATLEGFNNGKNTLAGGIIYETDASTLNNLNTVLLDVDEYIFPEKNIEFDFPNKDITTVKYNNDSHNVANFNIKINNQNRNDLYNSLLRPLYKTYVTDRLLNASGIDHSYNVDIHIDKSMLDTNNVLNVHDFVFPNPNSNLYYKDGDQDKLVTKVNAYNFHFSLNHKGKHLDLTCDNLVIDVDAVYTLCDTVGHNGYEVIDDDDYYTFRDEPDAHIINLPEFNVSYSGVTYTYTGFGENVFLDTHMGPKINSLGIQIRTKDTPQNIALMNQDIHLGNILRLFTIFNEDGTKKYDPKRKEFVDKDEYISDDDTVDLVKDRYELFNNSSLVGILVNKGYKPTNYKDYIDNVKETKKNNLASLNIKHGYAYFTDVLPIPGDLFKFDDYNQPKVYEGFPLIGIDEDVIKINRNSNPEGSGKIIATEELKFTSSDIIVDNYKHIYPFIKLCASDPYGNPVTYHGITIQNTSTEGYDLVENGITYKRFGALINTLAAPYDVKFKDANDTDVVNIASDHAPLVYNKSIQRIRIESQPDRKGELQVLLGYGLIYLCIDPSYDKPEVPTTPMKYIIDNGTSIIKAKSKLFNSTVYYDYVLGPASTDELAKYYDKYVHVLCPEDHPGLGTYEFCKYRIPLYNLDETKKYNYSNKAWELVGSTTDDSLTLEEIYPTEYAEARNNGKEPQVYTNPGYELNAI